MKNVSREVVLATPIPIPPMAEQFRIVGRVNELRLLCIDLRQRLDCQLKVQMNLSSSLLFD
jgi:type I restriction enzyme S subunit